MLSILSSIPPCPGSKFPKSFISIVLLMLDADKSPIWLKTLNISPIKAIYKYDYNLRESKKHHLFD